MDIYSPNEYASMRHDLDHVLKKIGELYDVRIQPDRLECTPLSIVPAGVHWSTQQSHDHFNALIPQFKTLHMAMYVILEAVAKQELKKASVSKAFELMDPLFTPFRQLNNQFKHFERRGVDIQLLPIALLVGTAQTRLEPMYRVNGLNIPYGRFVVMFLSLLKKAGAISY